MGRRRSSLPRPRVRDRGHEHRAWAPARRRCDPPTGRAPAAHVGGAQAPAVHRGGRSHRRPGAVPRPSQGVPLQQRGRGGRRRHQAGAADHGAHGHRRLPAGVPRPHHGRHHADHGQGGLPGGLRAAPAGRLHRPLLHPDTRHRRPHLGRRGAGRPRRDHRGARRHARRDGGRARAGRGRLHRAARRVADGSPAALLRPRDPAGVRRGAVRLRAHRTTLRRRDLRASPPMSSSSRRGWRQGCRWRGSWPGPS